MEQTKRSYEELEAELKLLRLQVEEANETIDAIRHGQVDALIVNGINGHELYTLKSADQTYRVFIEKMTEGAVTLNQQGVIVYSNSQFGKIVGKPLSVVTGTAFETLVSADDLDTYHHLVEKGWKEDIKGEVVLNGQFGTIPVQLSLTTLELDEGTALSIILTDLTVHKENQALLKLNNEKLLEINNDLELSNHDLQQFASVASHDLQEPLRKIQIFSNFLKEKYTEELPEEALGYLTKIISSSSRMKVLIIDILNYSRLSFSETLFEPVDLNAVMVELLEDYEMLITEKTAQITTHKLPTVEANPGQIRQVFQNIISNALKFSKIGTPPSIQITAKEVVADGTLFPVALPGKYHAITITDNGIGFDEQFASNIFTLFRRLHTKDRFEGTGIGLAISKKIIEKHKGFIMAESKEGVGSSFTILLPLITSNLDQNDKVENIIGGG